MDTIKKKGLEVKWFTPTDQPVAGVPIVYKDVVYVGTTNLGGNGSIYAINANTGAIKKSIAITGGVLASPLVDANSVYVFGYKGKLHKYDLALNQKWTYQTNFNAGANAGLDSAWLGPIKINTGKKDAIIIGVNSDDEFPGETRLGVAGIAAIDANTGSELWRTIITAKGTGGSGLWSLSPSYSKKLNMIFVTTGQTTRINKFPPNLPTSNDSVYGIDAKNGKIVWHTQVRTSNIAQADIWSFSDPFDPKKPLDTDIGDGPALFSVGEKEYLGFGSKRGYFYVVDAKTGKIVNSKFVHGSDVDSLGFKRTTIDAFNYDGSGVVGNSLDGGFNLDSGYYRHKGDIIHFAILSDYKKGLKEVAAKMPPWDGTHGAPAGTCFVGGFGLGTPPESANCPLIDKGNIVLMDAKGNKEIGRYVLPQRHVFAPIYLNGMIIASTTSNESASGGSTNPNSIVIIDVTNPHSPKLVKDIPLTKNGISAISGGSAISVGNGMIYSGNGFFGFGPQQGLFAIGLKK